MRRLLIFEANWKLVIWSGAQLEFQAERISEVIFPKSCILQRGKVIFSGSQWNKWQNTD